MVSTVRVKAAIVEDDTGIKSEIPVLISEYGVLEPLMDYLLQKQQEGRSQTWVDRVVRATQKLIDYMEANIRGFSNPRILFQTFAKRLYSGTIGDDGYDPSGLYWIPTSTNTTNQLIAALTGFTDWLAEHQGVEHMNPLVEADSFTQRLNYAAWFRKNQNDFLGHIEDKNVNKTVRKARNIKGRRELIRKDDDAVAFPEKDFEKFYLNGIGGALDARSALRDKLIVLLMHGGGLRKSEALSLWVSDVLEEPDNPNTALVRIYHPEDGVAPNGWRGRSGKTNRAAYLMENYALTSRKELLGTQRLGWKTRVVDHDDNYIQVHWFSSEFGVLFMALWQDYLRYLVSIDRHHPYAFVAFKTGYLGNPYTLNAFHDNYQKGLKRIGIAPNKANGYGPHGHRHAYGRRLTKASVDPVIRKKCLHHASLESQTVYTAPSLKQISDSLNKATVRLEGLADSNEYIPPVTDWQSLTRYGFDDIDPQGYFTGKIPKLGIK